VLYGTPVPGIRLSLDTLFGAMIEALFGAMIEAIVKRSR
jgi:hypothetical protein